MLWDNNGSLMEFPRPSRIIFGKLIVLIFKEMEDLII
jgi:hypothetical protein